jgi:hypothetical protein
VSVRVIASHFRRERGFITTLTRLWIATFTERFFSWTPYPYGELHRRRGHEERALIEAGARDPSLGLPLRGRARTSIHDG